MKQEEQFFGKSNYFLMVLGVVLIIIGFMLMVAKGSADPNEFNEKVFDFQRLTLAPILIIAGFIVEFFAIFKK